MPGRRCWRGTFSFSQCKLCRARCFIWSKYKLCPIKSIPACLVAVRAPHRRSSDKCVWFRWSCGPAHRPIEQYPYRPGRRSWQRDAENCAGILFPAPHPHTCTALSVPPISVGGQVLFRFWCERFAPEAVFCFFRVLQQFAAEFSGEQDGADLTFEGDFCLALLNSFHRDIWYFADPDTGGSNGFHQKASRSRPN